jgi:geranylgeranyl diphosphate synthase type II
MAAVPSISWREYLLQKQTYINGLLDEFLPPEDQFPQTLHKAMRYSVMAGGKRIRPILVLTAYDSFGGCERRIIEPAACAVELVHTYSLIHDDLPCMDDDDLRRGMPTLHKKYNEATAVLAGDALHDLAFALIARCGSARVISELAAAIGTDGMIGGQMADVQSEGQKVTLEDVRYIHMHKTGALITACLRIGAILAGVEESVLERLSLYGEKIGLAFQIIDDILDVEGDQKKLGKKVGSDRKNQKATYPGTVGMDKARRDADQLIDEAIDICRDFGQKGDYFIYMAEYIARRES